MAVNREPAVEYIWALPESFPIAVSPSLGYRAAKRFFDVVGALLALFVLSPLLASIALLIKATSGGPAFYSHERVGYQGKAIRILKFRTMVSDADDLRKYLTEDRIAEFKRNYKLQNDPRVTKIGGYLRRMSLDELPQLFNILMGGMSLVGPRPVTREELKRYGHYAEFYESVRPGLTGMWQVSGRSSLPYHERIALDMKYIRNQSPQLDLKLILRTFGAVMQKKGAC